MDSDEKLVRRAARADQGALAELYERHGKIAYGIAYRALRDASLAEDAVQEAFLQLWRDAKRYDGRRSRVGTWICVLAHRRAVDIARREARRRVTDPGAVEPEVDSYTAEEVAVLRHDRREVQRALGHLSDKQRELVELAYYGGLTQRELSERLDVPLGTIKSRMVQALTLLHGALVGA
jgi:RNA polymerase sigma-70 factor (ECF subfamily)